MLSWNWQVGSMPCMFASTTSDSGTSTQSGLPAIQLVSHHLRVIKEELRNVAFRQKVRLPPGRVMMHDG